MSTPLNVGLKHPERGWEDFYETDHLPRRGEIVETHRGVFAVATVVWRPTVRGSSRLAATVILRDP